MVIAILYWSTFVVLPSLSRILYTEVVLVILVISMNLAKTFHKFFVKLDIFLKTSMKL